MNPKTPKKNRFKGNLGVLMKALKALFKDRSIFFQLLAGGLSIMGLMVLVALIVNTSYTRRAEYALKRRWLLSSIDMQVHQLRQSEQTFLSREMFQRAFYDSAQSEAVKQFRAIIPQATNSVDSLLSIEDTDGDAGSTTIKDDLQNYSSKFEELVNLQFERGRNESGIYGEWSRASEALDSLAQRAHAEELRIRLSRAQADAIYPTTSTSSSILDTVTTISNQLRKAGSSIPQLPAALNSVDSLFKKLYETQQKIGITSKDGLQAELQNKGTALQSSVDAMAKDAERDSEAAQRALSLMTPAVLLVGLVCAAIFFYAFAAWISGMATKLKDTAEEVGRGHLDARVNISNHGELGLLAEEFNHMVQNLEALVAAVQKSGVQINRSAVQLASTSQEQHSTATEIAATTSEISATAKEISATSQELASSMKHVSEVAEKTSEIAASGQSGIGLMESTMQQITEASESISSRLGALSEKAGNITAVVTTIAKVADQTNLLSLNAAIEAEKAGEYGRGFAVVATEIRRLADQTATATSDIERIVKEMQSAVTAGVMGMDKFSEEVRRGVQASNKVGGQLSEIINQVQTLAPNFEMVNEGMQSQAEGAKQISDSLTQLGATAQQTAVSLQHSSEAIEQLNEASRNLQQGVARFSFRGSGGGN